MTKPAYMRKDVLVCDSCDGESSDMLSNWCLLTMIQAGETESYNFCPGCADRVRRLIKKMCGRERNNA